MNIDFTPEQTDVLAAHATANNKTSEAVVLEWIDGLVAAKRAHDAASLQQASDVLSYEKRQELKGIMQDFIQANA